MRAIARCAFAVAALSAGVLTLPGVVGAADWPQFHHDAARTGFNAHESIINSANVSDLSVEWSIAIGSVIVTPPVVAGGKVFAGSDDGKLYVLDAESGAVLWTGQTGAVIRLAPAVDGSRVYVASEDTVVYAFPVSCSTPCAPLWTAGLAGRPTAAPAVVGGAVYVGAGSGASGELWAFDGPTGGVLWRAPLNDSPGGVAAADDVVFASGPYAFPTSCSTPCEPLWIGAGGGYALPAVSGGLLYVDAGYVNNRFNAYPVSCVTPCFPVWVGATNSGNRNSVPAIAEGRVFWNDGDGTLAAYSVGGDFFPIWAVTGGYGSAPAVANGIVYAGTGSGMSALDVTTGAQLASLDTGDAATTPAIVDGSVFTSTVGFTAGGRVVRLGLPYDAVPPVITVPADIVVDATTPGGASVAYSVTATDEVDGLVPVTCAPPSGSVFPIGDTRVDCTATDASGNEGSASFTVHVRGGSELIVDLMSDVSNLGPPATPQFKSGLSFMLMRAVMSLARNDMRAACSDLGTFVRWVQEALRPPPKLALTEAQALISDARRIRFVIGC